MATFGARNVVHFRHGREEAMPQVGRKDRYGDLNISRSKCPKFEELAGLGVVHGEPTLG